MRAAPVVAAAALVLELSPAYAASPACTAEMRTTVPSLAEVLQSEHDLADAEAALDTATIRATRAKAARDKAVEDLAHASEDQRDAKLAKVASATTDYAKAEQERADAKAKADCVQREDVAIHHHYDLARTLAFDVGIGVAAAGAVDGVNRVGIILPSLQWRDGMFRSWEFAFVADSTQLLAPHGGALDAHHNWGAGVRARATFGRDAAFFLSAGSEILLRGEDQPGHLDDRVALIGQLGARFRIAQSGGSAGGFADAAIFAEPWFVLGSPGIPVSVLFGAELRFGAGGYVQPPQVRWRQ